MVRNINLLCANSQASFTVPLLTLKFCSLHKFTTLAGTECCRGV